MNIAEPLLAELKHEAAITRRVLERIPSDRLDWRPHPRSMSLKDLAVHVATLPEWGHVTLATEELDFGTMEYTPPPVGSAADVVAIFDGHAATLADRLAAADARALLAPWTLKNKGEVVFTMPRAAVLRSMILNHLVHHRGQLSVYLRLLDIPVPSIYGPSADEAA